MRKRRVIIFNDDPGTASALSNFFDARGYETVVFRAPAICPVSRKNEKCPGSPSCGDIAVIRHDMPSMNAIALLAAQQQGGCGLSTANKAIVAGSLDAKDRVSVAALGARLFTTPLNFRTLETWVAECETRMDLDRPVAIRRREERLEAGSEWLSLFLRGEEVERVALVNKSGCGVCFRTSRRLMPNQLLSIHVDSPGTTEDATVRWVRPEAGGSYLVGLCYCI